MNNILDRLNASQREAVLYNSGPLLIMAGAGSGKTRVVTYKIAYLIENGFASENEILAITFTNKAAKEMKDRVASFLNKDVIPMWIGTFHSIALRLLRRHANLVGYTNSFTIYDRDNQITLIKDILKELELDPKTYVPSYFIALISNLKMQNMDADEYESISDSYRKKTDAEVYRRYQKKMLEYDAMDFDDMIVNCVRLLEENEDVRQIYQERFKYVFVDEYQDTNFMQYKMAKLFSDMYKNICVVGDADQSIYGWRGADIRNILNFEKDYKNVKTILLEQNYRSTKNILKAANKIIKNNDERKEKNLWTDNQDGDDVYCYITQSNVEESYFVAQKIKELLDEGYKESDFAILYRTNAQSRSFEDMFLKFGIKYNIVGGVKFYDRKEIKDILAYFKFLDNTNDFISLKRIINTPKRGIGDKSIESITGDMISKNISLYDALSISTNKKIKEFFEVVESIKKLKDNVTLSELYDLVLDRTDYLNALERENTVEARTRIENLDEFRNLLLDYEDNYDNITLKDFLGEISLLTDLDKTEDKGGDAVTMITMHSAKGLEYNIVFIVGMEDGLFPSERAIEEGSLEEERRLCYVALTRAMKKLFLSLAKERRVYGQSIISKPSRFIDEAEDAIKVVSYRSDKFDERPILENASLNKSVYKERGFDKTVSRFKSYAGTDSAPSDKKDIKAGDKIKHKAFGEGMVVSVNGKNLTISFPNKGIKILNIDFAPLKRIDWYG